MKGESRVEAIVYTTNTGSAAQYAEMLAKETGLAAYSLDEARGKVPADSEVICLGWVMAGTVKVHRPRGLRGGHDAAGRAGKNPARAE